MAGNTPWTEERIKRAQQLLKKAHTVEEVARTMRCDTSTMRRVFLKHGLPNPTELLPKQDLPTELATLRTKSRERVNASRVKEMQRRIIELESREDFFSNLRTIPSIAINTSRPKSGRRPATPLTMASDWHVGEVVTEEETLGRNRYDLAEAKRRAGNFWDNVLWLRADAKRTQTCDDHVLCLNGDMVSGSIHPELESTNEVELADQVSEAAALIKPGIEALAKDSRRVIVTCTSGNHGRWTTKTRIKTGYGTNVETLLYRLLKAELAACENIEWIIPRAQGAAIDVHGHRLQVQHGTEIKSQGGIGGILVPLNRWAIRAASAHYYLFGHFHQAECFGKVVVNGSLIGDSAYSKWHALEYREPEQVGFVIDERRGLRRFERISVT